MSSRLLTRVLALALAGVALVPVTSPSASAAAEPPTLTVDTSAAALGSVLRLEGEGWLTQDGSSGSVIGLKIDDGKYSRLPAQAVHANLTIWAIIEADSDGSFSADVRLPDGTDSTPAFGPGRHSLRLLTGTLKTGDTQRTMLVPEFAVTAPESTTSLSLTPASAAYGATVRATVSVTSQGAPAAGDVVLTRGTVNLGTVNLGRATLAGGAASFAIPSAKLGVGRHAITARYVGAGIAASQASATATLTAAPSTTRLTLPRKAVKPRVRAAATIVVSSALSRVGTVAVMKGKKVIATVRLTASNNGRASVRLPALAKGKHRLVALFRGSTTVAGSTSAAVVLTVR